jgi:diguanylate cyclase (GGDEF)-like protein/PAS domain S-box-containing protein
VTNLQRILLAACAGVVLVSAVWVAVARKSTSAPAVLRVGVDDSPPFYLIQPDGSVRGLAVDVLDEAARRKGLKIQWTPLHDMPLEDALNKRVVDLWPLVGITPERRRSLHLTKPWIQADYVLVSLRSAPVRNPSEAAGKSVAHARLHFTGLIAKEFLARSIKTVRTMRADAIQALCKGEVSAAVLENYALNAILLARPPGCETAEFHVANLTGATTPLTLAAVPEAAEPAEMLRSAITEMSNDGFLGESLDQWSPFAAQGTRSIFEKEVAEERSRFYSYCLTIIAALGCVLAWLTFRALRLRGAAERAEAGRLEIQRRFTAFMDHSPAIAFMKDAAGRLLYVNRAWTQAFHLTQEEVYGKTDFNLWPGTTARKLRATDEALLSENKPRQLVEQIPVAGSIPRDWLIVKFPFSNQDGERFVGGTAIDISERESAIRELEASEARYRQLFEHNPLPAWVYDRETLAFLAVNEAAVESYGWTREDFLSGMTLCDVICTDEPCFVSGDGAVIDAAHAQRRNWHHLTKQGWRHNVEVTGYELEYNQRPARLVIIRDLTEQERMLEQLRTSEERWQLALRGAGDALWDWDVLSGRIYRSARWCTMLGYQEGEIGDTRADFLALLHPDDHEPTLRAVENHLARKTSESFSAEYRLRHKDGTWRWVMDRGQAVWDERGVPVRMAGSHTDITARKVNESLLTLQARTDALTGVSNRRDFERSFAEHFRAARANRRILTVCLCDLDNFKTVNDVYGHAAGDRVLISFTRIMQDYLKSTDLLARIGGDEFVISMPDTRADDAIALVEQMRQELRALPFEGSAGSFTVTSSFGVAELNADHPDSQSLLADADRLLYDAKGSGRDKTLAA